MTQLVDEVWVPSQYVRDCCIQSGVPADRVFVVPLGVACDRFHPGAPPLPLNSKKRFKFLFVGGTIHRKGIDLLLAAYARTFNSSDDVCLVIKDVGVRSDYRGQTAEKLIADYQRQPNAPEIEYLDRNLSEPELAGLYTACQCLVHPYRGEGFGLPIAEAMACGRPAVVTGGGAALDFCSRQNAWLLPAQVIRFQTKSVDDQPTVDFPWLLEPYLGALQTYLRHVVEHEEEVRAKGMAARDHIRNHLTWNHTCLAIEDRLYKLRKLPVRRLLAKPQPQITASGLPRNGRPRVSLCMMVRNEEKNLSTCLGSVADLVDEKILVDTGSTDRTKKVAANYGCRIFDFPWVDSFAAARNEGLRHASGDWIFWLDADDQLDEENRARIRKLFTGLDSDNVAFVMKCLSVPNDPRDAGTVVDHVRLFPNLRHLQWEFRVHEQILPSLRRLGVQTRWSDVLIHHTGYKDLSLRRHKLHRDLRLLNLELEEHPDEPFTLFNLGSVQLELQRHAEAIPMLERSLALSDPKDSIVRKIFAQLAQARRHLNQREKALADCCKGRELYPDDVEILFQEALVRSELGDLSGAEACLLRLLEPKETDHFASLDKGLAGYKARHNLAVLYFDQGRSAAAEKQWELALNENPKFLPACLGLAEVHLKQQSWESLDRLVEGAFQDGAYLEASLLRARKHLAKREFEAAKEILGSTIASAADAVAPRRILSYVLMQEGKDWPAAEQALRDLLSLDPTDTEARNNLTVIMKRNGGSIQVTNS